MKLLSCIRGDPLLHLAQMGDCMRADALAPPRSQASPPMHPNEPLGGSGACMRAGALATAPSPTCGAAKHQVPPHGGARAPSWRRTSPATHPQGPPMDPPVWARCNRVASNVHDLTPRGLAGVGKGSLAVHEGTLPLAQWTGSCPQGVMTDTPHGHPLTIRGSGCLHGGARAEPPSPGVGSPRGGAVTPKGFGRVRGGTLGEGAMDPKPCHAHPQPW
jgi:hypothetical protein